MDLLKQLAERRFQARLRDLERRADTPARARALAKAGYGRLAPAERLDFLERSLPPAVAETPEAGRGEAFWRLVDSAAAKLSGEARRGLPARWLERLGAELRPKPYIATLRDTLARGLGPLDPADRQSADARLIELLAIDRGLEQPDLAEVLGPGDHPIVLGPWTMEVGFELLYWIPLLRRYLREAGIPRERVVAISRGGVGAWYQDIAGRYVELFDRLSPDAFRALGEEIEQEHEGKKPFRPTEPERRLVADIAEELGLEGHRTLYPAALYGLFRTTWLKRFGGEIFLPALDYAPLPRDLPRPEGLPFEGPYVAVKFYRSEFFEGERVAPFVERLLRRLTERHRVVLLNTGLRVDDHSDAAELLPGIPRDRLVDATPLLGASDNLAVQTALVAHADKLYCTFGGFSYLGPLLGVDTLSFFTHTHFVSSHLDLALRAFNREGYGALAFLPVAAMDEAATAAVAGPGAGADSGARP